MLGNLSRLPLIACTRWRLFVEHTSEKHGQLRWIQLSLNDCRVLRSNWELKKLRYADIQRNTNASATVLCKALNRYDSSNFAQFSVLASTCGSAMVKFCVFQTRFRFPACCLAIPSNTITTFASNSSKFRLILFCNFRFHVFKLTQ
jgi:hypothetical protein